LYGNKKLVFKVVDDNELGAVDARTEYSGETVTITCTRSVENSAALGVSRDRMTLAHELGHAIMHSGETNFRHAGATGATPLSATAACKSAEHQAKVFASAFLIHDDLAASMSIEEISVQFGVSLEAAKICFERLLKKAERARSIERVLKMNEEAKAALLGKKPLSICRWGGSNLGFCRCGSVINLVGEIALYRRPINELCAAWELDASNSYPAPVKIVYVYSAAVNQAVPWEEPLVGHPQSFIF
jgi:hypothetical protein